MHAVRFLAAAALAALTASTHDVFGCPEHSLLGPLLVGAAAGIYLPNFAKQRWGWIPFNAALCGFAGLATADGSGFSTDRTAQAVDLGVEGMLRVEVRLGTLRPWLGLTLVTWLRQQTLEVTGAATSVVLPRAEPMIAVGADFCGQP